uniref:Uncharacterized protein n=1 Tax=Anguilla anguilla TaxID=7936 RepID=A0A0E9QD37_ANGAN
MESRMEQFYFSGLSMNSTGDF